MDEKHLSEEMEKVGSQHGGRYSDGDDDSDFGEAALHFKMHIAIGEGRAKQRANRRMLSGLPQLHKSVIHHATETVELLLEHGADTRARNHDTGTIALHEATKMDRVDVLKVLLLGDPDSIQCLDSAGLSALTLAMKERKQKVFDFLVTDYSPQCFLPHQTNPVNHPILLAAQSNGECEWSGEELVKTLVKNQCSAYVNEKHIVHYAVSCMDWYAVEVVVENTTPTNTDVTLALERAREMKREGLEGNTQCKPIIDILKGISNKNSRGQSNTDSATDVLAVANGTLGVNDT